MHKFKTLLVLITLFFFNSVYSQEQNLRAYLDSKQFYAPGAGEYLEIYFQFVGYSVKYKQVEQGIQGEISVSVKIFEGDSIVSQDAYRLQTPLIKDSIVEDFYDVKRIGLMPGRYTLAIELQDLNSTSKPIKATQPFVIEELGSTISVSDIEILEYATTGDASSPFYKSGYNMIPRLSTFYPSQLNSIPTYLEFYNTNTLEDSVCGVKQYIIDMDSGMELKDFTVFTKHATGEVVPILRNVDITKITTGKYALNYTLLSRSMTELSTQSYLFERSNDIEEIWDVETLVLDPSFQASISNDSVAYYLESLIPIASHTEVKNIIALLKVKDIERERKHIQAFWLKTAPNTTYDSWIKYKGQVNLVQKLYSNNFQEGFETDRGRVYLQYGSPNNIIAREYTETEYPYEIWQYNKIGVFSNKKFVFYNPDLVNNAYRLLHSDLIGEIKNPSWSLVLSKRTSIDPNATNPNRAFGEGSNDLLKQY